MQNSNHPGHPAANRVDERTEALRAEIARLAALDQMEYELDRLEVAQQHGIRPTTLDRLAEAARRKKADGGLDIGDDEPWPDGVHIVDLLNDARALQSRFIAGNQIQLDIVPLWVAHTYLVHHPKIELQISPRLAVQSADRDSGKTTLLELVSHLCPRAVMLSSTSAAGFYHLAQQRATAIVDEIEQLRPGSPLHHILNGSHRRSDANVLRANFASGTGEAKVSTTWCALAFGGIGQLPATLQSRSIVVNMRPAMAGEVPEVLDGEPTEAADLRRKFARWAADLDELPQVDLPSGIINRSRDNWRILARIAQLAGSEWVERVHLAAQNAAQQERPSSTAMLLESVRRAFGDRDQITTNELLLGLLRDEEYSEVWATANHGRKISDCWLRERFHPLLEPKKSVKLPGGRGYARMQFADAFRRYLPSAPVAEQPEPNPAVQAEQTADQQPEQAPEVQPELEQQPAKKTKTTKSKRVPKMKIIEIPKAADNDGTLVTVPDTAATE